MAVPSMSGVLDLSDVEATFVAALDQREADLRNSYVPNEWADISKEVYSWTTARTYLAPVLCGLLARSVSESADPLSLQVSDAGDSGSYAAASVWTLIRGHAEGRMFLQNLKGAPLNNSPFNGKKRVDVHWSNVSSVNAPRFARLVQLLTDVSTMSQAEARAALRSFLYAAPNPPATDMFGASVEAGGVSLQSMFTEVERFLQDNSENGRRGQALTAAAFALIHGDGVDTPQSINDPSRGAPGDVRVLRAEEPRRALFAEAKQKVVQGEALTSFATEVREFDASGVTGYAALANRKTVATGRARQDLALPDWRSILDETGTLMAVWDNPADLIRDAIVWSALDVTTAVARLSALYARFLGHVEVDEKTIPQWREAAERFGVLLEAEIKDN